MKIKKIIPYLLILIALLILTPFVINSFIKSANKKANEYVQNFKPVTANLSDGKYHGKFKAFGIITISEVEFQIENKIVKNIKFKRMLHTPGSPYKETILNQIKETRKLEVDAITGASRTSNFAKAAIKAAIENEK